MSISVQGITKSFAGMGNKRERKLVLRDISFEVNEGEFVSLVGPSGCGKTTTLTIIAGFQTADSGQVLVNGSPVTKPGPDRAFVFQNYALLPWLKVKDNIMYPMKKQGVPRAERERRLQELLAIAQMEESAGDLYGLTKVMQEIMSIIKYSCKKPLDEESFHYCRFVTHLKFFVQRMLTHTTYRGDDSGELLAVVKKQYPQAYQCTDRVGQFTERCHSYPLSDEERLYLTIHIARILEKSQ